MRKPFSHFCNYNYLGYNGEKNNFELLITSSYRTEKLACEIYYKGELVANLSQETEDPLLAIYSCPIAKWWNIPIDEFIDILQVAKKYLVSGA